MSVLTQKRENSMMNMENRFFPFQQFVLFMAE